MTSKPEPLLYTLEEAAEVLRLSYSVVQRLAQAGEIDSVRVGERAVRISRPAIDRWIAKVEQRGRIGRSRK